MPTVLITGANRGIGLELARQYLAAGWQVIATCRDPATAGELHGLARDTLRVLPLDVTDTGALAGFGAAVGREPIDVLLNNAGIIGPVPVAAHIERQHFGSIDYALWGEVLRTNTFAPVRLAELLLPNVLASRQKKIVTISSTVGSLTERLTPAFAYATSKTAVNKAMSLLAAILKPQGVSVGLICPGYVRTRMDFGGATVEIPDSAAGVRRVIDELSLANSGQFRRYNGETVAW